MMQFLRAMRSASRYHCPTGPEYSKICEDEEMAYLALSHLPILVGITGPSKAGKTMVAKHLAAEHRFHYASLSLLLREKATYLGKIAPTWRDLRDIALRWRREEGNTVLVDHLFQRMLTEGVLRKERAIVIDGLLHPDEVEALAFRPNFALIAITADRKLRYELAKDWFSFDRVLSWEEFVQRDKWELGIELGATPRPVEAPNIQQCIDMTPRERQFIFDGSERELLEKINDFIRTLHV
jgi:dephospho-CoA kinase